MRLQALGRHVANHEARTILIGVIDLNRNALGRDAENLRQNRDDIVAAGEALEPDHGVTGLVRQFRGHPFTPRYSEASGLIGLALANLLVGPPPPNDASEDEQIAWCEQVDEEMERLDRRLDRREPNPDGNPLRRNADL
jgi:hypothetical protein